MNKTLHVRIEIPKRDKKWRVICSTSNNPQPYKKNSAGVAYALVERKIRSFLSLGVGHKTVVSVKDGQYHNFGEYTDYKMALFALAAFLEDYLSKQTLALKYKKYGGV